MVNSTIHSSAKNATISFLMRYRSVLFLVLFLSIVASLSGPAMAESSDTLDTSVDRSQIYQNETVELTIIGQLELELNFSSLFSLRNMELPTPDVGDLENDFEIIDQQQKYNIQSINGVNNATITWVYTLAPKRSGELTIPEIKHNEKASTPITIKVLEGKPSADDGQPPMIFLEAEVDKPSVYVQEQLVYTLRLYHADNLAGGELSNPELDNAIVEQVGDQKKYNRMRYNRRYEVIERKFLIFPQQSGELNIAPQTFSGTIIDTRMRKRRHVRDTTEAISVNVMPPAKAFTGQTWLPAISLNLTEKWDKPLENVTVGDAFTRTLSIQSLGLLGSALPPINLTESNGFKQYPDQPNTESQEHPAGVESSRTQSIAMVAVKAGTFTLPEIKIPWWDTINQVERIAIIPSRTLTIAAGSGTQAQSETGAKDELTSAPEKGDNQPSEQPENSSSNAKTEASDSDNSSVYVVVIVLLLAGWGITTFILLRRRTAGTLQAAPSSPSPTSSEHGAFEVLSESIKQRSPAIMGNMVTWAKLKWPNAHINSIADLERFLDDEAFTVLMARVESYYYSPDASKNEGSQWDESALLKRLIKIRKKQATPSDHALPGFYPK